MICFATIWTNEYYVRLRSNIWADLYLVIDPNKKSFSRFQWGATFFQNISAMKRIYVNFFLLTRNLDLGLMNDRYYYKKTRSNEIVLRFQNKLMVLVVLTNCFRKKIFNFFFLNFAFIYFIFVVQELIVSIQRSSYF